MAKTPTWDEWFSAFDDGKLAVVKAGLDGGFDLNSRAGPSWSPEETDPPLSRAMGNTRGTKVALFAIEHGADPNAPDQGGMTPLMWAASFGDLQLIEALIEAGADPRARLVKRTKNLLIKDGLTPVEIALAEGNKKAAQLIETLMSGKGPVKESAFEQKLSALRQAAFSAIDFEGSEEPVAKELVGVDRSDCFHSIGKTGSDSVFALWTSKPGARLETAPVVYLDSEGDPRSVVAASLDEFLTILPYGTSTLYDLLSNPKQKLVATKALKDHFGAEEDIGDEPFRKWWKTNFGVAPAKDPAAVIAAVAQTTQAFQAWLKKKPR